MHMQAAHLNDLLIHFRSQSNLATVDKLWNAVFVYPDGLRGDHGCGDIEIKMCLLVHKLFTAVL